MIELWPERGKAREEKEEREENKKRKTGRKQRGKENNGWWLNTHL